MPVTKTKSEDEKDKPSREERIEYERLSWLVDCLEFGSESYGPYAGVDDYLRYPELKI